MEETMSNDAAPGKAAETEKPFWQEGLAPFAKPHLGRSLLDLATSVVPFFALWALMYLTLGDVSYWVTLALAVPTAGFLLRTFIVFHDCTHGSFLPTKRANALLGAFTGLLVFSPFARWRHQHAVHHASAGDLDRRGVGDVQTLTVAEYRAMSRKGRLGYRLFRNPLVMFGIGPIYSLVVMPRFVPRDARPRMRRSVHLTNAVLAVTLVALGLLLGWAEFWMVEFPVIMLAGSAGVWLFYVQHQFEDAYWESSEKWSYADAALRGSSYLKLPKVLQFFTGNIGLHHVHHLSARVPNYNLQRAHDENPIFHDVPVITFWDGIKAVRFKLIDEETGRLVGFDAARDEPAASASRSPATESA
jgi:omega-6 fatty acid desaturase (delta-12 desaturase)